MPEYIKGAALPNFTDTWTDFDGNTINFSTGYTFIGRIYDPTDEVLWSTKTTGFTGAATSPNISISWDVDELDLNPGNYIFFITATRTSDSKKYKTMYSLRISVDGEATVFIPEPTLYGVPAGTADNDILVWNNTLEAWEAEQLIVGKATDAYAISNTDDAGTYKYFGFEDSTGGWYILRKTVATNIFLYAKGASAYSTAWTGRVGQSYASYESTF